MNESILAIQLHLLMVMMLIYVYDIASGCYSRRSILYKILYTNTIYPVYLFWTLLL